MAAGFTGLNVLVTLSNKDLPRGTQVRGLVSGVHDRCLSLSQVTVISTGVRLGKLEVYGDDITDIEVTESSPRIAPNEPGTLSPGAGQQQVKQFGAVLRPPLLAPQHTSAPAPATTRPNRSRDFQDPAILTYGSVRLANRSSKEGKKLALDNFTRDESAHVIIDTVTQDDQVTKPAELEVDPISSDQRKHRVRANKILKPFIKDTASGSETSPEFVRPVPVSQRDGSIGPDGWRQTPILAVPNSKPAQRLAKTATEVTPRKKTKSRQRVAKAQPQSGWATEDATDVQGMGDFDFAENLSKFDKRAVFEQLRNEDTTADEELLVSFNRIPRPGTFGGTKMHPTENVLDATTRVSDEAAHSRHFEANGHTLKSRTSLKNTSRRNSAMVESRLNNSVSSTSLNRVNSPLGMGQLRAENSLSPALHSSGHRHPCLRYVGSGRSCPVVTSQALDDVERDYNYVLADGDLEYADLKFTDNAVLMANAARAIADVALGILNPGGRRLGVGNINSKPVVVFLIGEDEPFKKRSGLRSLVAARALSQRNVRVLVCVLPRDHALGLRPDSLQRFSLWYDAEQMLSWKQTAALLKTLDSPPELIIDAYRAGSFSPTESGTVSSRDVEIVAWANKSKASVLAVDTPSGVDNESGETMIWEGEPLEIRARAVVCCGAPRTGLLRALKRRGGEDGPRIFVGDIGISEEWKAFNTEHDLPQKVIDFGTDWIAQVRFDPGN